MSPAYPVLHGSHLPPVSAQLIAALDGIIEEAVAAKRKLIQATVSTADRPLDLQEAIRAVLANGRPQRRARVGLAVEALTGVRPTTRQLNEAFEALQAAGDLSFHAPSTWVRLVKRFPSGEASTGYQAPSPV